MRNAFIILLFVGGVLNAQTFKMGGNTQANNITVQNLRADSITIGTSPDYVTLGATDGIRLHGEATQWDDMTISALSLAGGVQAPSLRAIIGGISMQAFNFQTANDIVHGLAQLSHGWVYADSIEAHIHCAIEASPSAGDTVVVDFEYAWVDINEVITSSDTIRLKIPVASWTAKQHKLVELGWLDGADKTLSSNLLFRIERRRDLASDTYDSANNWWHLFDVDFHYRRSKFGSANEVTD